MARLSRWVLGRRLLSASVNSLASASGMHLYVIEQRADGTLRSVVSSAAVAALVGGEPGPGTDVDAWYDAHVHPDDRERYDTTFSIERMRDGGHVDLEYRIVGEDGLTRTVLETARGRPLGRGVVIEGAVRDVTAERQMERERDEARRQLTSVVGNISELLYTIQCVDGAWRTTWIGPNWSELFGDVTVGNAASVMLARTHPDDRGYVLSGNDQLAAGEPIEQLYRLVDADGVERWVLDRVRPRIGPAGEVLADGILIDVTAQRSAERRVEDLVESLGLVVYGGRMTPGRTLADVVPSAGVEAILGDALPAGVSPAEAWAGAIHPGDRERYLETFAYARLVELRPVSCEYRMRRLDGSIRWVWERAFPRQVLDGGDVVVEGVVTDVSERHQAMRRVAEAEDRLSRVLVAVEEFVYTAELADGRPVTPLFRGPGLERLIGVADDTGSDAWEIWSSRVDPKDRVAHLAHFDRLRNGEASSVTYRLHGLDGVVRWVNARGYPRPSTPGGPIAFDGIVSDVTERQLAAEALQQARDDAERRSRVDTLTGVYNRAHFVEALSAELNRGARDHSLPGVVMLDIDHFKRVNDTFLHAAGDEVLRQVAGRVAAAVREYDVVARWGGEEFVVLVPGVATEEALRTVAETLRSAVSATPIPIGDDELAVTASAGAALAGVGRSTVEALIDAADRALYSAKRRGRDRVRVYGELSDQDFLMEEPDAIRIAEAMSRSASVREGVPELHCAQVADLAARTAQALGLGATAVLRCRLAGWLHDVGKVAIPDRILSKPGPLDDDEWSVMRTHAAIGGEIVGRIPGLADVAPVIRHHHERVDGRGYPDQLIDEQIPIEARIVAAVDAFSAMTEDRSYRRGMSFDDAIDELRRSAGAHLDWIVVDALTRLLTADVAATSATE